VIRVSEVQELMRERARLLHRTENAETRLASLEEQLQSAERKLRGYRAPFTSTQEAWRRADELQEQFDAVRYALCEIHEYTCGCDTPGSKSTCVASPVEEFEIITKTDIEWAYEKGQQRRNHESTQNELNN
jgi:hypothetical protein